jgi:putative hydrolase
MDRTADWHTHSCLTDGADEPERMARAAAVSGLTTWGLSDHVRSDSTWVPEYIQRVRQLHVEDLIVRCGVEAKIMDVRGRLDLPNGLAGLDYVLIADHQFPGAGGPISPHEIRVGLANGDLEASAVIEQLVDATLAAAMACPFPPILAHLFSLLPKCGLSEDDISADALGRLVTGSQGIGVRVEVNEKWRCPSPRVLRRLVEAEVELTAGSDAHRYQDIGMHSYLDEVLMPVQEGL